MRTTPDASNSDAPDDPRTRLIHYTSVCIARHCHADDHWDLVPILALDPFPEIGSITVLGIRHCRRLLLDISWGPDRIVWHDVDGGNGRFLAVATWDRGLLPRDVPEPG